jgi:hypothetical protein
MLAKVSNAAEQIRPDAFGQTQNTWIDVQLERGIEGRQSVNRHVMDTYAWPLQVYFLGTNMRWLGEPDEIVNGFFASRLPREDFFAMWQASGMRLRRWLMNGLCLYLKEVRKRRLRDAPGGGAAGIEHEAITFTGDPDLVVDRASAISFVQRAMAAAERACQQKDMSVHWRVFLRHHVDGMDFRALANEFGVDEARAAVMSRSAERNFKSALTEVLLKDGVHPEQINSEIGRLLEAMGS